MAEDPIQRFKGALLRAQQYETQDATCCVLATASPEGRPSARCVLLKHVDARGFVVYTNHGSRKAQEMNANPWASLCFYWPTRDEQVRVEGRVEVVESQEADAYFATRPRQSQLGAWASLQSQELANESELHQRLQHVSERYEGTEVPRPDFWGGYRLLPHRIEFWQAGDFRLHTRSVFTRSDRGWELIHLYP